MCGARRKLEFRRVQQGNDIQSRALTMELEKRVKRKDVVDLLTGRPAARNKPGLPGKVYLVGEPRIIFLRPE